jgi:hypothetical protein
MGKDIGLKLEHSWNMLFLQHQVTHVFAAFFWLYSSSSATDSTRVNLFTIVTSQLIYRTVSPDEALPHSSPMIAPWPCWWLQTTFRCHSHPGASMGELKHGYLIMSLKVVYEQRDNAKHNGKNYWSIFLQNNSLHKLLQSSIFVCRQLFCNFLFVVYNNFGLNQALKLIHVGSIHNRGAARGDFLLGI